jgi:hypothetical protein
MILSSWDRAFWRLCGHSPRDIISCYLRFRKYKNIHYYSYAFFWYFYFPKNDYKEESIDKFCFSGHIYNYIYNGIFKLAFDTYWSPRISLPSNNDSANSEFRIKPKETFPKNENYQESCCPSWKHEVDQVEGYPRRWLQAELQYYIPTGIISYFKLSNPTRSNQKCHISFS